MTVPPKRRRLSLSRNRRPKRSKRQSHKKRVNIISPAIGDQLSSRGSVLYLATIRSRLLAHSKTIQTNRAREMIGSADHRTNAEMIWFSFPWFGLSFPHSTLFLGLKNGMREISTVRHSVQDCRIQEASIKAVVPCRCLSIIASTTMRA
jgi:hypothetical protein